MDTVTLIDGRVVSTASEEWRHECEARAVLALPNKNARICYLDGWAEYEGRPPNQKKKTHRGVLQCRGQEARDELAALVMTIWQLRRKPA